jgi:hypothetical protein
MVHRPRLWGVLNDSGPSDERSNTGVMTLLEGRSLKEAEIAGKGGPPRRRTCTRLESIDTTVGGKQRPVFENLHMVVDNWASHDQ